MTGFIKGLFGKKQQDTAQNNGNVPSPKQGSYYLDPDDAKTFGDIDYMRTSKTVKRTFAKGSARVRQVSAMEDVDANSSTAPSPSASSSMGTPSQSSSQPTQSAPTFSAQEQRRSSDSSMDMFRNMAKDIRKK
jgi:hypothetical protein